ncbi:MAG: response regulator transcription factor [Opitutales bacterium]
MAAKPKPLILIVEDEKELATLISEQLEMAGMMTQVYHRAGNVLRFLQKNFANLMLLDIALPDTSGFHLLEELKKNNLQIPVIFLTASTSEVHKVKGLDMGGDDYITKPFSFPELIARINAVLRRAETSRDYHITKNARLSEQQFTFCGAQVDPTRLEMIFPDGGHEKIGRKELGILLYLVSNPNNVLTRRSLIHAVWGIHADVRSRSLDQYIVKIRDMLNRHGCDADCFRTIHGVGYIYDPERRGAAAVS